jgi:four helix bundle protein
VDVDVNVDVDGAEPTALHAESYRMSEDDEGVFGFEKLDVYQRAVEFLAVAARLVQELPPGQQPLADQLKGAALSVPVNVAEGVGRTSAADRRRHYAIARGSAMECAAILDACRILEIAATGLVRQGRSLLIRVVSMLTRMCRP